jgi:hypothetical protein
MTQINISNALFEVIATIADGTEGLLVGVVPSTSLDGDPAEAIVILDQRALDQPGLVMVVQNDNIALHGANDALADRITALMDGRFKQHPDWKAKQ